MINPDSDAWREIERHITSMRDLALKELKTARKKREVIEKQERIRVLEKLLALPATSPLPPVAPLGFESR